jgi:phage terminase large subunit-like protein
MTQDILFSEDGLRKHVTHPSRLPTRGVDVCDICIFDTASSTASAADYSAGVAVRLTEESGEKHFWITEIVYGQYDSKELAFQIGRFTRKHPGEVVIEKMTHHTLLEREIQRHNADVHISWIPAGNTKNCKQKRINKFADLVNQGRVHFIAGSWVDETFAQLLRTARRDDIADALGRVAEV